MKVLNGILLILLTWTVGLVAYTVGVQNGERKSSTACKAELALVEKGYMAKVDGVVGQCNTSLAGLDAEWRNHLNDEEAAYKAKTAAYSTMLNAIIRSRPYPTIIPLEKKAGQ